MKQVSHAEEPASGAGISRRLVFVMAAAAGISVANLYYAQPLLNSIAAIFHAGVTTAGLVVTMSQLGYAAGLFLLVPAGDMLDRRRIVLSVLAVTPFAMLAAALAPSINFLIAASLVVGVSSVIVHVLVPFAASLASDEEQGQVVGIVISGLLVGILLARTLAGFIADVAGWRTVYYMGAALMILLLLVLRKELPPDRPQAGISYAQTLRSTVALILHQRTVQFRAIYGTLGFAAFSAFWTTIAFVLARPPYGYSDSVIGLFGLFGAAGATAASFAGRFADRGLTSVATGSFGALLFGSFLLLWLAPGSVAVMIIGTVLIDVAIQGQHVLNQSENYRAVPDGRSRANGAYMTVNFIGGTIGSAAGAVLYAHAGWSAVCLLGAGLGAAQFLVWLIERRG